MPNRSVEDKLRAEYFDLLPEVRRVAEHLEAEVRYRILPISRTLESFERMVVRSRIKECESALESLRHRRRRRMEGAIFDLDRIEEYTLTDLKDLAGGVRVLAFPKSRMEAIDVVLRAAEVFQGWQADPVVSDSGETLAFKYSGYCSPASTRIIGEYQIVSVLTGLFWEVEHSAIYKPVPRLKSAVRSPELQHVLTPVLRSLGSFEDEFERSIRADPYSTNA